MDSLTLTQLRQNLFELADRVIDTGESLLIERRGVRLRLSRETQVASSGRLARLMPQALVLGKALLPDESPALWSATSSAQVTDAASALQEPMSDWGAAPARKRAPAKHARKQ